MKNMMNGTIFLIRMSIVLILLSCSKSTKYEFDTFLRAPDSTQTALLTNQSWQPETDLKTDVALFMPGSDAQIVESWQQQDYRIQFQIDSNVLNKSRFDANIPAKKYPEIVPVTGTEPLLFHSETPQILNLLKSPIHNGLQGKLKVDASVIDLDQPEDPTCLFKKAFLKGSYFKNLARFTQKPLWFNPEVTNSGGNLNPADLLAAYQQTMVALLMHPEVTGFHFQPISNFPGAVNPDSQNVKSNRKFVAWMALFNNILHKLPQFKPEDITWYCTGRYIGELVSASMDFKEAPYVERPALLAPALMNMGIPCERLILERCHEANYLNGYRILFLDYPLQRLPDPNIHKNLAQWIRSGGILILSGKTEASEMPASSGREESGFATPIEHLLNCLEMPKSPENKSYPYGKGRIIFRQNLPGTSEITPAQTALFRQLVEEAVSFIPDKFYHFKPQNYICLYRGPLVMAAVMPDTENKKMLEIPGTCIDCLTPDYSLIDEKIVVPGEVALLFNLKKYQSKINDVILSNSKISNQKLNASELSFDSQGPSGIECHTFIKLNLMPREIVVQSAAGTVPYQMEWYPKEKLLRLVYPMRINGVRVKLIC